MRISIIVPVYNKEPYIEDCIRSLVIQSYKNIEILVFDDGSTDDSMGIVKRFKDKRIATFGDGKNHGVSFARNRLIEAARGKIVALQDADDISHPDRISVQYWGMKKFKTPRIRCSKVFDHEFDVARNNWLSGKEPFPGPPQGIKRTSGAFGSEMFVKTPMVPFREDLRFREEILWVSHMRVVWNGAINLKKRLYAKRKVWDETAMSYWWLDKKNAAERKRAADIYHARVRKRPAYIAKLREQALVVKKQITDGEFFPCE
jgi:glycosyltransferase involved in cell wall biosynthesis